MRTKTWTIAGAGLALSLGSAASAQLDPRKVQIASVDFDAAVVELKNFDTVAVDLNTWRFCTHDFDQFRRYTNADGLNGRSLAPGGSLFIYFNNDGPVQADSINIASIGGLFATPLSRQAYAMELYFSADGIVNFNANTDMMDHIQWAEDPSNVGQTAARSAQAVTAGLWTVSTAFIDLEADSERVDLDDTTGAELHGPADYTITNPFVCAADLNGDGILDNGDISTFIPLFLAQDPAVDFNGDGIIDNGDIAEFIALFLAGC